MRLLPCLALVSLLLAACATAAPSDPAVGSPPPASAAPQPEESAPQGSPPAMPSPAPVLLDEPVVTVSDDARRLRVYLPDPMPPGPVPLLVFLHPFGGTPSEAVRDTGFDRIAGEEGFVAVFPPADGRGWSAAVAAGTFDSDVDERYLAGMIDALLASYPIDPERVVLAGFSVGGAMTDRVACRLAERVAAAAIVGGNLWAGPCEPARPVPILIVHGTDDNAYPYADAERLAAAWRARNGCDGQPRISLAGASVSTATSLDCRDGSTVEFVTVSDGWHAWFDEPDATGVVWDFFEEHAGT